MHIVRKVIASVGAVLFFVLLGGAAAGAVRQNSLHGAEASLMTGTVGALHDDAEALTGASGSAAVVPRGGMSAEERERREAACVKGWESDMDWCKRTRKVADRSVCEKRAKDRLADCMSRF